MTDFNHPEWKALITVLAKAALYEAYKELGEEELMQRLCDRHTPPEQTPLE